MEAILKGISQREQLVILVQTAVVAEPKRFGSTKAVLAVSMALRADCDIPHDLLDATDQIIEYVDSDGAWPHWVREDFGGYE